MKVYEFFGAHEEGVQKMFKIGNLSLFEFASKEWALLNSVGAYNSSGLIGAVDYGYTPILFDSEPLTINGGIRFNEMANYRDFLTNGAEVDLPANSTQEVLQLLNFASDYGQGQPSDVFEWILIELEKTLSKPAFMNIEGILNEFFEFFNDGYVLKMMRAINNAKEVFDEGRNTWRGYIAEAHYSIDYLFEVEDIENNFNEHFCGFWNDDLHLNEIARGLAILQQYLRQFFTEFGNVEFVGVCTKTKAMELESIRAEQSKLLSRKWDLKGKINEILRNTDTKEGLDELEAAFAKLQK